MRVQSGIGVHKTKITAANVVARPLIALFAAALLSGCLNSGSLQPEKASTLSSSDQRKLQASIDEALESLVSGESLTWRSDDSGVSGVITPIRTFRAESISTWCREYRHVISANAPEPVDLTRIACRVAAKTWRMCVPGAASCQ